MVPLEGAVIERESGIGVGLCKSCMCSADVCAHCGDDGVGEFVSDVGGDAHVSGKSVATLLWMELELASGRMGALMQVAGSGCCAVLYTPPHTPADSGGLNIKIT